MASSSSGQTLSDFSSETAPRRASSLNEEMRTRDELSSNSDASAPS